MIKFVELVGIYIWLGIGLLLLWTRKVLLHPVFYFSVVFAQSAGVINIFALFSLIPKDDAAILLLLLEKNSWLFYAFAVIMSLGVIYPLLSWVPLILTSVLEKKVLECLFGVLLFFIVTIPFVSYYLIASRALLPAEYFSITPFLNFIGTVSLVAYPFAFLERVILGTVFTGLIISNGVYLYIALKFM